MICIILVKRNRMFSLALMTNLDAENLVWGSIFLPVGVSWPDSGCTSALTNLCFWLCFQGDGFGGGPVCVEGACACTCVSARRERLPD